MDIILGKEHGITKHSFLCKLKSGTRRVTLMNAADSPYQQGWTEYAPFESKDGKNWIRVAKGHYNGGTFSFSVSSKAQYACWFPPYEINQMKKICRLFKKEGKDVFFLGDEIKPTIVFIAGQHPAETMGLYFLEGILQAASSSKNFLQNYSVLVIPYVNKKGVLHKNHRLTPEGVDLNREWANPKNLLLCSIKKIIATKNIYAIVDIHGDEVSKKDYVIHNKDFKGSCLEKICFRQGFLLLKGQSIFKKNIKSLFQHGKITFSYGQTAREYFGEKHILSITLELSAYQNTPKSCMEKGKAFILDWMYNS